jgi:hypothetical protein
MEVDTVSFGGNAANAMAMHVTTSPDTLQSSSLSSRA